MTVLSEIQCLTFPTVSETHGFAPESPRVLPERVLNGNGGRAVEFPLEFQGELLLDFGRMLTGRVHIEIDGPVEYFYASNLEQLRDHLKQGKDCLFYNQHNTYVHSSPFGRLLPSSDGGPVLLEKGMSVLRLLRLRSEDRVKIRRLWVDFSPPHQPLVGSFNCDNAALNRAWLMDAYTVQMCTQQNTDSIDRVPAPGSGYVIWDGPRRDREVWAGDLRPSSWAWRAVFQDLEPIRNSLYMLWNGRHHVCEHMGLVPGSASSHQVFYEWTLWFLVNCWEYYYMSEDEDFLDSLMSPAGLDLTYQWMRRMSNEQGIIEATNGWTWTLNLQGELSATAMVQMQAYEALAQLFSAAHRYEKSEECAALAANLRKAIPKRFFDPQAKAFRMWPLQSGKQPLFPLDAHAFAVLNGLGDEAMREACLDALNSDMFRRPGGLRCYSPAFPEDQEGWYMNKETSWLHNKTVWPYANCYAAWAQMEAGRLEQGFNTLTQFHDALAAMGEATVFEAIMEDGSNPIPAHGNLVSLCHAWGATGTHLMHHYVLGVQMAGMGYREVSIRPNLGPLQYASGKVPTAHGPIEVELEKRSDGKTKGCVRLPEGVKAVEMAEGILEL